MDLDLLKSKIRSVEDWPKPGVVFRDITPALEDKESFKFLIDEMARLAQEAGQGEGIDKIVGIDARGFILASALAYKIGAGLAIARKKGKLPRETIYRQYGLEYAADCLEMRKDSIRAGERVLIVDDVLATGGTMRAVCDIVKELGGEIAGILFFIELEGLKGREKLAGQKVESLLKF